jgi:hypothetical protein
LAEPLNALFAADTITVSHTPGGGGASSDLSGYWDQGHDEYETDGYRPTVHRVITNHFTFPSSGVGIAEGDTMQKSGLNYPVLDVVTDGVVTTLTLGQGLAPGNVLYDRGGDIIYDRAGDAIHARTVLA